MNEQVLIAAIKSNLSRSGNAEVIEAAMAALGHAHLGGQVARDMVRLAEVRKRADAQRFEFAGTVFNADSTDDADYSKEIKRRTEYFYEGVRAINAALGIDATGA